MKGMALCVASVGVLLGMANVHAAGMAKGSVSRVYTDSVAPAEQQAYVAGIKSYNKCLAEHGFKFTWTAWAHETGDTYQYSYVSDPLSWAAFDEMHKQGKVCDTVWQTAVNRHLKSETSAFAIDKPELSHSGKTTAPSGAIMDVIFFKLKPGHEAVEAFTDVVKKIAAAADKSSWPYYYRTVQVMDAGAGAPDFMVLIYSKSWADFGIEPDPSLWKMVANVSGQPEADAMRKSLGAAVAEQSSHVDSLDAELTYHASGH